MSACVRACICMNEGGACVSVHMRFQCRLEGLPKKREGLAKATISRKKIDCYENIHQWNATELGRVRHSAMKKVRKLRHRCPFFRNIPLQKWPCGISLITIEFHSVSMLFQHDSVVLSTVIKIPFNTNERYKESKISFKKPFKYHSNTIQKPMVFECYFL